MRTGTVGKKKFKDVKSKVVTAKVKALDMLCRMFGLYKDTTEADALLGKVLASIPPALALAVRVALAGQPSRDETATGGDLPDGDGHPQLPPR